MATIKFNSLNSENSTEMIDSENLTEMIDLKVESEKGNQEAIKAFESLRGGSGCCWKTTEE
jgi:hypothetical protein